MASETSSIRPAALDALRGLLDLLTDKIIVALKRRSELPQNLVIYSKSEGLFIDFPWTPVLSDQVVVGPVSHYANLERYRERYHESVSAVESELLSDLSADHSSSPIDPLIHAKALAYYQQWIARCCAAGDVPDSYVETLEADFKALLALNERICLGKRVAESKLATQRGGLEASGGADAVLRALISRPEREKEVIGKVKRWAQSYAFPVEQAEAWGRWIIDSTITVEIDYLRHRLGFRSPPAPLA